ncbi:hypothetical protein CR513_06036, partial [Mucuna pruriens]
MEPKGECDYQVRMIPKHPRYRQSGYPLVLPLPEEAVTSFVIHGLGGQNGECLRKIWHAWKSVVKSGLEWGPWSCGASSTYRSWLRHRIECTLLKFNDPRFNATEKRSIESQRPLKRSREVDPDP